MGCSTGDIDNTLDRAGAIQPSDLSSICQQIVFVDAQGRGRDIITRKECFGDGENSIWEMSSYMSSFGKPNAVNDGYHQKALRWLIDFPESGHPIPKFPDLPHREFLFAPYRFFYRLKGRTVWIVAVWHGARLPREPAGGDR